MEHENQKLELTRHYLLATNPDGDESGYVDVLSWESGATVVEYLLKNDPACSCLASSVIVSETATVRAREVVEEFDATLENMLGCFGTEVDEYVKTNLERIRAMQRYEK